MRMTPDVMIATARKDNPTIRYALRVEPNADGGAVLGAFCTNAGGFVPVATESGRNTGQWSKMPPGYLEIDGKAVGIDPENWRE